LAAVFCPKNLAIAGKNCFARLSVLQSPARTPMDKRGFYRVMLRRARLCHSILSVCPSVRDGPSACKQCNV